MKQFKVFGERICTYCGGKMLYINFTNNQPLGLCDCGNTDWCDNKTEDDVKKQYGSHLRPSRIKILEMDD